MRLLASCKSGYRWIRTNTPGTTYQWTSNIVGIRGGSL